MVALEVALEVAVVGEPRLRVHHFLEHFARLRLRRRRVVARIFVLQLLHLGAEVPVVEGGAAG